MTRPNRRRRPDADTLVGGPPECGVRRVFAADSGQVSRVQLDRLNDVDAGRLAVLVRPGLRRRSWLTSDLLAALGVRPDASDAGRDEDRDWLLAHIWLVVREVRDLVVVHAEWLPPDLLTEVILLAQGANATVWLVSSPPRSDEQVGALDDWVGHELTWAAFRAHWEPKVPGLLRDRRRAVDTSTPDRTDPAVGPVSDVPALLPDDDFPTFRAACRAVLSADQFAAVDRRLRGEVRAMLRWAAAGDAAVTVEGVHEHLRDRYDRCATTGELLVAARGAQLALFSLGWFMQVDLLRFAGMAEHAPRRAARTAARWRGLRVYRLPDRGAVCALAAAGLDLRQMSALRVADCATDGSTVTLDGRDWPVEPAAAEYLRALVLLRTAHGASGGGPLLADERGNPVRERRPADLITAVRVETGLVVTSRLIARDRPNPGRWYTQWGISIQSLTGPAA